MDSWSIEHIPAGGGASTFASFETWGFAALQMQFVNWGVDRASITSRGGSIAFDAAQFGYKDKIVVWRDGARHSHWWIVGPGLNAEAQESRTYTLAGPAWWLDQTPFQQPQHIVDITTDPETGAATGCTWEMLHGTEVVWSSWPAQSSGTINGQIHRALWCAIDNDAPIAIGAVDMPGLAAPIGSAGTCFSVMQQAARLLPRSACWWDCSGATPLFHASSRAGLTDQTLTIGTHDIELFGLHPRADQRMDAVRVVYSYPDGDGYGAWFDTAGDDTLKDGPNTLRATIECSTSEIASNAASHYGIAAQLYGALSETPWEGSVIIHDTGAGLPIVPLGAKLSLAGGRSEWAAMAATITQIQIDVTASANDILSVSMGAPPALGAQDIFEALNMLLDAGAGAVATTGGTTDPTPDPGDEDPIPGTYDDLNDGAQLGGAPLGEVVVESRGGNYTIVGAGPLNGIESSPPRRWLRQDWDGENLEEQWVGNGVCGGGVTAWQAITMNGAAVWSAATGAVTSNTGVAVRTGTAGGETSPQTPGAHLGTNNGIGGTRTTTATVDRWQRDGVCRDIAGDGTGSGRFTGYNETTLSGECTDDVAYAAQSAGDEWQRPGLTAIHTERTSGLTFTRRKARYRTEHTEGTGAEAVTYPTLSSLEPWQRYQLIVTLERRPVDSGGAPTGSGEWASAGTLTHMFIADLDGKGGVDWQEIEPTAGYETRVASTIVEVAP